jgi:hypothetical protein
VRHQRLPLPVECNHIAITGDTLIAIDCINSRSTPCNRSHQALPFVKAAAKAKLAGSIEAHPGDHLATFSAFRITDFPIMAARNKDVRRERVVFGFHCRKLGLDITYRAVVGRSNASWRCAARMTVQANISTAKRQAGDESRLWLRLNIRRSPANLTRIDCKIVRPKQRRVPAASGRCGARKLESTSRLRASHEWMVTCRQSQKRDGKIPEATKLHRHLLHRIALNQVTSSEL